FFLSSGALRALPSFPTDALPISWAKLGPVLYVQEGPALVREFAARGVRVFLDLKWHDIPTVVAGAVAAARDLGAAMATVHCLGGDRKSTRLNSSHVSISYAVFCL